MEHVKGLGMKCPRRRCFPRRDPGDPRAVGSTRDMRKRVARSRGLLGRRGWPRGGGEVCALHVKSWISSIGTPEIEVYGFFINR